MTLAALPYPQIDPVLLHLGPLELRWYALAYLAGLVLAGWGIIRALRDKALWNAPPFNGKPPASEDDISDMAVWALMGVIVGGRLGYDLFYSTLLCGLRPAPFCDGLPADFLIHPQRILAEWHGWVPELRGMSFHGGLLGVVVAVWLFCRAHKLRFLAIADLACAFAPSNALSLASLFCAGAGLGLIAPHLFAAGQTLAGPGIAGKWIGVQNGLGNLSGIIGPIVTGVIIDRTGGYEGGFLVAAAVSIVGVAAWGFIIPQISPIDWTKR